MSNAKFAEFVEVSILVVFSGHLNEEKCRIYPCFLRFEIGIPGNEAKHDRRRSS